jgi:enoyl-CoA hydratase/carnithine racemase
VAEREAADVAELRNDAAMEPLLTSVEEGVLTLTLNRPEKRNALSIELRRAIAAAFAGLDTEAIGAVVITGAPPAFCSGMDTTQFGGDAENRKALVDSSLACMNAIGDCPVPIVTAINGPALAGGFLVALASDIRIAEPTARFGFPELPRGIPPSFAWARAALPAALARELCQSGRIVEAADAAALGVVSRLVGEDESLAAATELATTIASRPRRAVLESKRRVLLERHTLYGFLFEDEERMFRAALGTD